MKTDVTVALSVHDSESHILGCLGSLLNQSVREFEIVIVEDPPFDRTTHIVSSLDDARIRYLRNRKHLGISGTRNRCVDLANGRYIFFTDDDCVVAGNWVEQGLRSLTQCDCIGVEGKTYYVSEAYRHTMSDGIVENLNGGQFMTCNIAYRTSIFKNIGGFDERLTYLEDRDLALRATKVGNILFNPEMIVYHQKKTLKPVQFVRAGKRIRNRVLLYKKYRDKPLIKWRIVNPSGLVAVIFPPLIIVSLFRNKYKTKEDFALFPFIYMQLVYERLNLWYMCYKERVFLM